MQAWKGDVWRLPYWTNNKKIDLPSQEKHGLK